MAGANTAAERFDSPVGLAQILRWLKEATLDKKLPAPDYVHIYTEILRLESVDTSVYKQFRWLRIFACSITVDTANDVDQIVIQLPYAKICSSNNLQGNSHTNVLTARFGC
jgi:hypothetical protein